MRRSVLLLLIAAAVVLVVAWWYSGCQYHAAAATFEQQRRAAATKMHSERLMARLQAAESVRQKDATRTRLHELVRMSRSVVAPERVPPTLPHFQPHTIPASETVHAVPATSQERRWWDVRENYETPDTRAQIDLLSTEGNAEDHVVVGDTRRSAVFRSHSENVMDDVVIGDMKRIISKIKANPTKCQHVSADTLVSDLKADPDSTAYNAATKMMNPTCRIGFGINMSCREVLDLVWKQVNDPRYNTRDLKDVLKMQLVDGLNRCPHGKVARSLSVFSGFDEELALRSTGFLNREMMDTASAMSAQRDDDGSDAADAVFREQLRARFHRDYVDTGIMSRDELEEELSKWLEHV